MGILMLQQYRRLLSICSAQDRTSCDAEPLTHEKMDELLDDIKSENMCRRLGGRVGVILPFKKPEKKG
jgi:hypothetical protein